MSHATNMQWLQGIRCSACGQSPRFDPCECWLPPIGPDGRDTGKRHVRHLLSIRADDVWLHRMSCPDCHAAREWSER